MKKAGLLLAALLATMAVALGGCAGGKAEDHQQAQQSGYPSFDQSFHALKKVLFAESCGIGTQFTQYSGLPSGR